MVINNESFMRVKDRETLEQVRWKLGLKGKPRFGK